jgi:sporulation protein YlmC with PRC-barrel domain
MDFEMDTDTGRIQAVRIKPSGMMKGLMKEELCVGWSQIIEIREDVVIVDDSVSKESVASAVRSTASASLIMASED